MDQELLSKSCWTIEELLELDELLLELDELLLSQPEHIIPNIRRWSSQLRHPYPLHMFGTLPNDR